MRKFLISLLCLCMVFTIVPYYGGVEFEGYAATTIVGRDGDPEVLSDEILPTLSGGFSSYTNNQYYSATMTWWKDFDAASPTALSETATPTKFVKYGVEISFKANADAIFASPLNLKVSATDIEVSGSEILKTEVSADGKYATATIAFYLGQSTAVSGQFSVTGETKAGKTLIVDYSKLIPNNADVYDFNWYRGDIFLASGTSYTATNSDIDSTLTVKASVRDEYKLQYTEGVLVNAVYTGVITGENGQYITIPNWTYGEVVPDFLINSSYNTAIGSGKYDWVIQSSGKTTSNYAQIKYGNNSWDELVASKSDIFPTEAGNYKLIFANNNDHKKEAYFTIDEYDLKNASLTNVEIKDVVKYENNTATYGKTEDGLSDVTYTDADNLIYNTYGRAVTDVTLQFNNARSGGVETVTATDYVIINDFNNLPTSVGKYNITVEADTNKNFKNSKTVQLEIKPLELKFATGTGFSGRAVKYQDGNNKVDLIPSTNTVFLAYATTGNYEYVASGSDYVRQYATQTDEYKVTRYTLSAYSSGTDAGEYSNCKIEAGNVGENYKVAPTPSIYIDIKIMPTSKALSFKDVTNIATDSNGFVYIAQYGDMLGSSRYNELLIQAKLYDYDTASQTLKNGTIASSSDYVYESSDPTVATVASNTGLITVLKTGWTKISVKAANGESGVAPGSFILYVTPRILTIATPLDLKQVWRANNFSADSLYTDTPGQIIDDQFFLDQYGKQNIGLKISNASPTVFTSAVAQNEPFEVTLSLDGLNKNYLNYFAFASTSNYDAFGDYDNWTKTLNAVDAKASIIKKTVAVSKVYIASGSDWVEITNIKDISSYTNVDRTYTGSEIKPFEDKDFWIQGTDNHDYKLSEGHFHIEYDRNVNAYEYDNENAVIKFVGDRISFTYESDATREFRILQKSIGINPTVESKVYDGTDKATLTDFNLTDEQVNADLASGTDYKVTVKFGSKNADSTANVTVNLQWETSAKARNYVIKGSDWQSPNGTWRNGAKIYRKKLTPVVTITDKVYDGTTNASITSIYFDGLIASESLASGTDFSSTATDYTISATFTDFNASSTDVPVDVFIKLSTATNSDAWNYTFGTETSTNKVTTYSGKSKAAIKYRKLTLGDVSVNNKVYDGSPDLGGNDVHATVSQTDNAFDPHGEVDAIASASNNTYDVWKNYIKKSAKFDDANAGQGKNVVIKVELLENDTTALKNYTFGEESQTRVTVATKSNTANIYYKKLVIKAVTATNKVYDGNDNAAVKLAFGASGTPVAADAVAIASASNYSISAKFASANASQTDMTVTVYASFSDAGNIALKNYTFGSETNERVTSITDESAKAYIYYKQLAIKAVTATDKVYDGDADADVTFAFDFADGVAVAADAAAIASESSYDFVGAFSDKNAAQNKKTVTATATNKNLGVLENYTFGVQEAGAAQDLDIATTTNAYLYYKQLTISAVTATNKVYDGNTAATVTDAVLHGFIEGESLALNSGFTATATFTDFNASTTDIPVNVVIILDRDNATASNYTFGSETAGTAQDRDEATTTNANIYYRKLVIDTVSTTDKVYDGNATATTVFTFKVAKGTPVAADAEAIASASSYAFVGAFVDKNASKDKKEVTATATNKNLGVLKNYTFGTEAAHQAQVVDIATITDAYLYYKQLAIKAVTATDKVYDGNAVAKINSAVLDGFIEGENLALDSGFTAVATFTDSNASTTDIPVDVVIILDSENATASNYTFGTEAPNEAQVVNIATNTSAYIYYRKLVIDTVSATDKVYDGNTVAQTVFTFKDANDTTVAADAAAIASASNYTFVGAFIDKNASKNNKAVYATATIFNIDALRNYTFGAQSARAAQELTIATTTDAKINFKKLIIKAVTAEDKTYNGNTDADVTFEFMAADNPVAEDAAAIASASNYRFVGAFSDKNAAQNKKTVTATATNLLNGALRNYTFGNEGEDQVLDIATTTDAKINFKKLTIKNVVVGNKVYDGNTTATVTGATVEGFIDGEELSLNNDFTATAAFEDKNAKTNKLATVKLTLKNATASNYTFGNEGENRVNTAEATTTNASITRKPITVSDTNVPAKTADGKKEMPGATAVLKGMLDGENLVQGEDYDVTCEADSAVAGTRNVTYTVTLKSATASNYGFGDNGSTSTTAGGQGSIVLATIVGGAPMPMSYVVTFDANGHGTAPTAQTVKSGSTAVAPTAPTAEGFVFGGWYKDAKCLTPYDFNSKVNANIKLYAKWTESKVDVASELEKIQLKARTAYTAKGNTKVTVTVVESADAVQAIKDAGYTVKYRFFRSTKKTSDYKNVFTTTKNVYTNTLGVTGKNYYYKARLAVYDAAGNMVGQTVLKQCLYGNRIFKGQAEER